MKIKNKTETIKKIGKYSFYGILCLTVILGFILLGWFLERYYENNKDFFYNSFGAFKFKKRHRILKIILRLTIYFFISITAIGFLILLGFLMRKFYVKNKGKIYQKLTNFRDYNIPKSMRVR